MPLTSPRNTARLAMLIVGLLLLTACSDPPPDAELARSRAIPEWFQDAKLGIFIHWGPASVPAFAAGPPLKIGELEEVLLGDSRRRELPYAEWYYYGMNIPGSETQRHHEATYGDAPYRNFVRSFEQRVDEHWNADDWASLFKRMGANYVVLVTKHHDGYTLWPSNVVNPHRQHWSSSRDIVGELARAVRNQGMRFGTYYSTGLDWTFRLETDGDLVRDVMRSAPPGEDYADYVYAHLQELIARYQPDVLWADIGYPTRGRLWDLLREYFVAVPQGTVNDRWGAVDTLGRIAEIPGTTAIMKALGRWSVSMASDPLADDPSRVGFKTAEYDALPDIAPYPWESTRGLGGSFAFNARERAQDMLSANELVESLSDVVAKRGNLLINVGPDSYGGITAMQQAPLLALGQWLTINGEAIYNTRPWQRYGNVNGRKLRYTQRDNTLYAIVPGVASAHFVIESPGISYQSLSVLGAQVSAVDEVKDQLKITLTSAPDTPAVVVRYAL
jgi:alpha-L-fucosidase